jgi:hypothetical protein
VTVVRDKATAIDPQKKTVRLQNGGNISYDKLVLSPGVDMVFDSIEGLQAANASGQVLQAWKAGPETLALRKQLEAMPDGGVYALTVPEAPYRCPPGPYERASQVAHYFKQAKPKSKVLILDANPDVTSKAGLFKKFWSDNYKDIIEYRPNHKVTAVDSQSIRFDVQEPVRADVMNVLPAMRAGAIAMQTGLATAKMAAIEVGVALPGPGQMLHDAAADDVARRELAHRVNALHEPSAGCIDQPRPFAADGLADQVPRSTGDIEARRMELHELEVGDRRARTPCHGDRIAGGHLRVGRLPIDLARAAAREHDRPGPHDLQAEARVPRQDARGATLARILPGQDIKREAAIEEPNRAQPAHLGDQRRSQRGAGRITIGMAATASGNVASSDPSPEALDSSSNRLATIKNSSN